MEQDVYRKLAQKFDELPNGFPATDNGVAEKSGDTILVFLRNRLTAGSDGTQAASRAGDACRSW